MPKYEEDIGAGDVSGAIGANTQQIASMQVQMDKINHSLDRMLNLFGKTRDLTRSEITELKAFREEISRAAQEFHSMNDANIKGMSDFSIYQKKLEENIESYKKKALDAESQIKKAREQNQKIEANVTGRFAKDKNKMLRDELQTQEKNSARLRQMAKERLDENKKIIDQNAQIAKTSKQQAESNSVSLKKAEEMSKRYKDIRQEQSRSVDLLEVAADLHLPGVSHAATVAKYARRGYESMVPAEDEAGGLGALGGMAGRGLGLAGGALAGGAIAFGGYTALQGYRAYNMANQMAPMARTLAGQMGPGSVAGRQQAVQAYGGYGGMEQLPTLMNLNRAIGGQYGIQNMRNITDAANRFGISREEAIGGAGELTRAGVAPGQAVEQQAKILSEGVKSGMDRARATEFLQQVTNLQKEIFRLTGEQSPENIAKSLGALMSASGMGARFAQGPAMQAVSGIDQAIKATGMGRMQGSAAGTLMRAFGFGQGGQTGMESLYQTNKMMEGGVFSGKPGEQIGKINKVFEQYMMEAGGEKNKHAAFERMSKELGIGRNQLESLDAIRKKAPGELTKKDMSDLKKLQEESKDPLLQLLDINKKMDANLAILAGSNSGVGSFIKIANMQLSVQQQSLEVLKTMAGIASPDETKGESFLGNMADFAGGAMKNVMKMIPGMNTGVQAYDVLKYGSEKLGMDKYVDKAKSFVKDKIGLGGSSDASGGSSKSEMDNTRATHENTKELRELRKQLANSGGQSSYSVSAKKPQMKPAHAR